MTELILLSKAQMARISPFFPVPHGICAVLDPQGARFHAPWVKKADDFRLRQDLRRCACGEGGGV